MDLARLVTRPRLAADLRALGIRPGDLVMSHESVREIGWVLGGPKEVGEAILEVVGPTGTWMKYVGSEDSTYEMPSWPAEVQALCREVYPPFDPARTPACRAWGILCEYLRTWPGVVRSNHPDSSFAAVGRLAAWLMAPHPLVDGMGPGSPLARLVEAGGRVLLLGAPYETTTLLHHSEYAAQIPNKRRIVPYEAPLRDADGTARWETIDELDTNLGIAEFGEGDPFDHIVADFVEAGHARVGQVGFARAVLMDAPALHGFGAAWMEAHVRPTPEAPEPGRGPNASAS